MKTYEIPIRINLIASPYCVENAVQALVIVEAKTKREAMSVAMNYPFFKEFV